jgi:hypothetical protein
MMLLLYNVQIQVCIYLIVWGDSSVDCTSDNDVVAVQCTNTGLYLEHVHCTATTSLSEVQSTEESPQTIR